ncbi:hypothetical protein [Pedobacter aquatilis]|uniref:hypothetical protein n=1 Tax=Pedobacter aquatilis TaxID=351343 RepID=UPI00292D8F95|nr:hypothetical protein [Pedobacter aquatilis]
MYKNCAYIILGVLQLNGLNIKAQKPEIRDSIRAGIHKIMIQADSTCSYWIGEKTISPLYRMPTSTYNGGSIQGSIGPNRDHKINYKSDKVSLTVWGGEKSSYIITNQRPKPIDLHISAYMDNLDIKYGNFKSINYMRAMTGSPINNFSIERVSADTITNYIGIKTWIHSSNIKTLNLGFPSMDFIKTKLEIINSRIDSLKFTSDLPDTILLQGIDFSGVKSFLDLSAPRKGAGRTVLAVREVDMSKLKFNLGDVWVYTFQDASYDDKIAVLQQMVKLCRDKGYSDDAARYDKAYQSEKYLHDGHWLLDYISWIWWDYGYDKGRVFYISLLLFTMFAIVNVILSHKIREVYWPDRFTMFYDRTNLQYSNQNMRKKMKHSMGMILFTAYIFWGVKLDLKELEIRNKWILLLIIAQYITGIICIAYLANFIISR